MSETCTRYDICRSENSGLHLVFGSQLDKQVTVKRFHRSGLLGSDAPADVQLPRT